MKKTYILWVLLAFAVLASGAILAGAGFALFMSVPSLIIVVLPAVFLSFAVFPIRETGSYFRYASMETATREQLLKAKAYFCLIQRATLYSGFVGVIIGLVALLTFLGEAEQVGSNAAVALLTALYALMINVIIVIPFRASVERKLAEI